MYPLLSVFAQDDPDSSQKHARVNYGMEYEDNIWKLNYPLHETGKIGVVMNFKKSENWEAD